MTKIKTARAHIVGRIAGAAVVAALSLGAPVVAITLAGPASADPAATTGEDPITDAALDNVVKNLPPSGNFFNPKKDPTDTIFQTIFWHRF